MVLMDIILEKVKVYVIDCMDIISFFFYRVIICDGGI